MEERTDSGGCLPVLIFDIGVALILWVALIILKAAGVVGMHWALVLSGLVWISWGLFALTALLVLIAKLKRGYRRRKTDARIIRQAKAAGVWDNPKALGGRALELKAWQDLKIKREPGEPDAHLRSRYMVRYDAFLTALRGQIGVAVQIPPEILYGGDKTNKQAKEEQQNE